MADPVPMNRNQRRQAERMAAKQPQPKTPAAAQPAPTAETPAAEAEQPKAEPRVIDGLAVDEQGRVLLSDEERADPELQFNAGVDPDATFGETAKRAMLLEAERDRFQQIAAAKHIALIKAKRRIRELEGQRDTALAAANAAAAPPADPEPAAD